jgi:squalene monooxygenase
VQTLPFSGKHQGVTLHHDRLLVQLRKMVLESPCISFIQGTVTEIVKENQTVKGVQIDTNQETMTVNAPLTLLSDGIFSRFREEFHPQKKKTMSQFVGLLLYNVPSDYSYYGHVLDTGPTIALLYKVLSMILMIRLILLRIVFLWMLL